MTEYESAARAVEAMSPELLADLRHRSAGDSTRIALLDEIDRLNTVLDANRVVRNAAESSSRTYKGVVELLKTQRTQLRAELAAANERAPLPSITDGITDAEAEASATFDLTIDEVRSLKADRDAALAECDRLTKSVERFDSSISALRHQAVEAVKARNEANERTQKAEREREKLRTDRDHCVAREVSKGLEARQLRRERDEARARLAELGEATVEWSVPLDGENGSPLPEKLARRMAAERWIPLMTRTAYREPPWRLAGEPANAAQDGRSATETGGDSSD